MIRRQSYGAGFSISKWVASVGGLCFGALFGIRVVGPAPAFIYKVKNRFRWRILLKGTKVGPLHRAVNHILNTVESGGRFKRSGIRFMADADPIHLF